MDYNARLSLTDALMLSITIYRSMTAQELQASGDESDHTYSVPYDTVIVFGEGPVKPILLPSELTKSQYNEWQAFYKDTLQSAEPDFWLLQSPKYLSQLQKIHIDNSLSNFKKNIACEEKRIEWQKIGWFALRKLGRQNALAAGHALYKGFAKEVIVTGGKTMPNFVKEMFSEERLTAWPSEASLMKDVIVRHYGKLYFEKYGKSIEEVIVVEERATNTLENFSYSINARPELLSGNLSIGLLSATHHLKRIGILAELFALPKESCCPLSAQDILQKAKDYGEMQYKYDEMEHAIADQENCLDVKAQYQRESLWLKGLQSPEYLTYWVGYVADVASPVVLQKTLERFTEGAWFDAAEKALGQVGINAREYREKDIIELSQKNPEEYLGFVKSLQRLKSPTYRKMPLFSVI